MFTDTRVSWQHAAIRPGAYPTAARVGAAAGAAHRSAYDPRHAYDFGLRRILDGLAVLVGDRHG